MRSVALLTIGLFVLFAGACIGAEEESLSSQEVTKEKMGTLTGVVRFSRRVAQAGGFGFDAEPEVKPPADPAARGLESTYIYLEPLGEQKTLPEEVSSEAGPLPQVKMNQTGFRFIPQVMVVRAGQRVLFGNDDSSDHNVRAYSEIQKNTFNIITTTKRSYTKVFELQKTGSPIKLACDFHPHMRGWIYVVGHDNVAITNGDGEFTIEGITPGSYKLNIVQPVVRLRSEAVVEIIEGSIFRSDTSFGLEHRYYESEPKTWIDSH